LFGSPDLCECQHCRSVFSPAAYLVELLRFLEKSTYTFKKEGGVEETHSPYEYLVGKPDVNPDINIAGRRPDLAKLELSCDNTNTLIPYIDLSNEVMESYIAAGSLEEYDENIRDVTADELRANPQHTNTQAYRILSNNDPSKTANYPFNLPFHQPLNVIRTYSDFLNTSRYEIMQAVNPEPNDISKKAIAAEALGFSEEEYRLLVGMNFNGNPVTTEAFEYFGYENVEELEELSPVQVFMNRIGTTYVELVELVKTRFINPHQYLLDYIEEHFSGTAIDGDILYGWLAKAAAGTNTPADDATLTAEDGSNLATPELVQWAQNNFAEFQQIITLFEPKSACNLDTTSLRTILAVYEKTESVDINGNIVSEITAEVWSRFHYFIRLWNKLSWSIHEVDLMLASLEQNEITFDTISKLESVVSLKKASNLPLNKLATLWGNIDTYGEESLYKQLFLNKAVQEIDKVFIADAQGNYLQEPLTKSLSEHQSTILAVFRISAEELNTILATASRNYNEVNPDENDRLTLEDKLSLENLSTIYRYVVLANAMKLSVTELCKLIELFDSKIKDDQLFSSPQKTIEFFKLVISTKEAGFKPALLDYIFTGSSPSDSTIGLDQNKTQQLATGIRDGFHAIEQSYPQEPEILNSEIVAATLSVSFKENAVSRLVSIVEGTVKFEALVANTNLDVKISNELANKYAYVKKTGLLSCLGVMSEAEKTALKALTNTTEIFNAVVDDLYAAPEIFISDNFSGILGDSDSFNQIILERPVQDPAILLDEKLEYIYSKFIPLIKNKLKREVITKNISDLIEQSEVSTGLLIENDIDELIENISKQGFSTSYFNNVDWSGDSVPVSENEMVNKELDISWIKSPVDERSIPQQVNDSFSVKWEAYIKAPASEFYTFLVDVEESDEVFNLYLDNVLILTKDALSDDVSFKTTDAINLDATQLYSLTLEYAEKSGSAGVRLRWKTATSTPEIIPASVAYPVHILDNFVQQVNTLHRAAAFIDRFDISEVELKHFITFKEDFGNIDFNSIEAKHFKRIFDYTKLRDSIPQNQAFLTEVFALANQIELMPEMESLKEIVLQATNWNSADLDFLVHLSQLNLDIGDFKNEIALNQILKIMTITTKTGLSAETISNSGKVETDFENLDDTAQILKNAVKAKYSNTEWLEVAGGLSDKIREQQKQALISYLLVQDTIKAARVKDADGLFEHLLIDVQMGACMDTSRIVQANAAIQLFVNRILLNLEGPYTARCH
ncbi:MAG: hypothetical protein KAI17_12300, partial [Thiotrichaceae bacterium]|nr:hypothetical protein [Thiotrichaceae bacterium]